MAHDSTQPRPPPHPVFFWPCPKIGWQFLDAPESQNSLDSFDALGDGIKYRLDDFFFSVAILVSLGKGGDVFRNILKDKHL